MASVGTTIIISFLVSLAYVGIGVAGLSLYSCSWDFSQSSNGYLIVLAYFMNTECRDVPAVLEPYWDLTETPSRSQRTHDVFMWLLVSAAIRAGSFVGIGIGCTRLFALIWILGVLGSLVGDAVCAVIYFADLGSSHSLADLLGDDRLNDYSYRNRWGSTEVPAVVLALICARFFVFWFYDLSIAYLVYKTEPEDPPQPTPVAPPVHVAVPVPVQVPVRVQQRRPVQVTESARVGVITDGDTTIAVVEENVTISDGVNVVRGTRIRGIVAQ